MIPQVQNGDFTLRELEIISLIQQGNTSQEIAKKLHVSELTIKKHRENIARKIGSHGKKEFRKFVRNFKT
ncbi:LuxR family transcriptional regulator [Cytophagaceae bacterium 50C-KIRBA]|uniref:LuxR family transcriptional regulator n=1 Tax=Aquirufa beregesia TaxID=2516556 RepID=A0ABX0EX86_9BACT|nr:helix-turn-helix transcriptional regulator [Aquirufa beregesia]NGZ44540.1 LuxR family transcriptional regulator [Aquirufa beregesia]